MTFSYARLAVVVTASSMMIACVGSSSDGKSSGTSADGGGATSTDPGTGGGPKRDDIDCATYLADAKSGAAAAKFSLSYAQGTWGGTIADLQALPQGATLCGTEFYKDNGGPTGQSGELVNTMIQSPLFGSALKAFYDPILTKLGCTLTSDGSTAEQTRLSYKCPAGKGGSVTIGTDTGANMYGVASQVP